MNTGAELVDTVEAMVQAHTLPEGVEHCVSVGHEEGHLAGTYLQFAFYTGCCKHETVEGTPWTVIEDSTERQSGSQCSGCGQQGHGYVMSEFARADLVDEADLEDWVQARIDAFATTLAERKADKTAALQAKLERMCQNAVKDFQAGLAQGWAFDPDQHDDLEEAQEKWLADHGIKPEGWVPDSDIDRYVAIDGGEMVAEGYLNFGPTGETGSETLLVRLPLQG